MTESVSSDSKPAERFAHRVYAALSLLPTPLLLFVSTSSDIYLRNQALLQYQHQVLAPFAKLFVLTLLVGAVVRALSGISRPARVFLWAYYLTGPLFLVFAFFRGLQGIVPGVDTLYGTSAGLTFWPILLLVATAILGPRLNRPSVVRAFAAFGIILLVYEGGTLLHNIWSAGVPTSGSVSPARLPAANSRQLPNIYHIIFDAYQTDLLEHTLTDEAKKALGGFTYFPNNKAEWSQTFMSLSAIFAGRRYAYDRTINSFMSRAFDSEVCILYWLKSQQYQTLAYVTNNWDSRVRYLDRVIYHGAAARDELLPLNEESFWNVWLYSNTPPPLRNAAMRSKWFGHLTEEDLEKLQEGRLLPATAPVTSYLGFKSLMATEKALSPSGRYTVAHVIIPHYPLRLRADCSYNLGSSKTHILEQSQCALKLIQDFVRLLKDLGRFDDSLIIIHGDHGDTYRTKNGELTENARSRSLDTVLLVKPVGKTGEGELEVLETRTSLVDVPMIIMNSVANAGTPGPHLPPWTPQRSFAPFVKGEQIESAEMILNRQGFVLGEVTNAPSELASGTVLSQDPPPYQAGGGTEGVSLVVSSGPPEGPDVMPDFVGRDVSEVAEWLARNRLPASSIRHVPHAVAPMGMVVAQTPPPGHQADGSKEISIYVSNNNP